MSQIREETVFFDCRCSILDSAGGMGRALPNHHSEGFKPMTYLDVVFRYGAVPGENEMRAIDTMREVYGIRRVQFNEKEGTVQVEFDASRLKRDAVAKLPRRLPAGGSGGAPTAGWRLSAIMLPPEREPPDVASDGGGAITSRERLCNAAEFLPGIA